MFVVDLSMHVDRSFQSDTDIGQLLLHWKRDVVAEGSRRQGLKGTIVVHPIVQIGTQCLFDMSQSRFAFCPGTAGTAVSSVRVAANLPIK